MFSHLVPVCFKNVCQTSLRQRMVNQDWLAVHVSSLGNSDSEVLLLGYGSESKPVNDSISMDNRLQCYIFGKYMQYYIALWTS